MSQPTPSRENKMGTMPINPLLLQMAIPIMLSMLVQALYNVVDSMFVAKLSEDALNAVSLAFPVQNLMISVAVGTGVGINSFLSKSLGEKKHAQANAAAENGLFLALCSSLVFFLFGLTCSRLFFTIQTDVPAIVDYGENYLSVITMLSFGLFFQITMERLLQSTGRSLLSMATQGFGAIINIILDPILIFGLFGLPRLEVLGAALATVFSQISASILALYLNLHKNHDIRLNFRGFRPSGDIIRNIYSVGVPSIAMSSIGSIMVFGFNRILLAFTTTATAVFGVYFKLQSFIFMPVFGLNNAVVPIVAYNYGARRPDRILHTIKLSILYAMGIMLAGFLLFQFAAPQLMSLFEAEEEISGQLVELGVTALRTISFSFLLAGFCIVSSSVYQALGHGMFSLIVSAIRQLVVLLPVAYLLAQTRGLSAVWWSFPIAELFSALLSAFFLYRAYRHEIAPMNALK